MQNKLMNKQLAALKLEPTNFRHQSSELKRIIYVVHGGKALFDIANGKCEKHIYNKVMQTVMFYTDKVIDLEHIMAELHFQQTFTPDEHEKIWLLNDDYSQALKRNEIINMLIDSKKQ